LDEDLRKEQQIAEQNRENEAVLAVNLRKEKLKRSETDIQRVDCDKSARKQIAAMRTQAAELQQRVADLRSAIENGTAGSIGEEQDVLNQLTQAENNEYIRLRRLHGLR
jgi:anti-sigma28 factor (negative regulator of flagellin synthesis)